MDLAVAATTFALIFPVELPDKTFVASLVLATRYRPLLVWVGVFLVAAPVLQGWQWVAVLSPLFVILLLTRVSGIPLLEKRADEKWGDRADYRAYRDATPVLIPALTARASAVSRG